MQHQPAITDYKGDTDHRGKSISETEIIEDIKRVGRIVGGAPTTREIEKFGNYSRTAIDNAFTTHTEALQEAGYGGPRDQFDRDAKKQELITEIKRVAAAIGRPPTIRCELLEHSKGTYYNYFDSWSDALEKAALDPSNKQKTGAAVDKVEFSEVVDQIISVALDVDRPPKQDEVVKNTEATRQTTTEIAGTWSETLHMAGFPARKRGGRYSNLKSSKVRDYGENWGRMKQKTLERDRFRCQHCGAKHAEEKQNGRGLNVHHIKPIRTFEEPEDGNFPENLISLCKDCHDKWEPMSQFVFTSDAAQEEAH
jgi:hypothetical protein